jgi:hypothetical protein
VEEVAGSRSGWDKFSIKRFVLDLKTKRGGVNRRLVIFIQTFFITKFASRTQLDLRSSTINFRRGVR